MGNIMGNYITIKQACECYNITRKTIYNWRSKGLLIEKNEGRSVLLDTESIEVQITRKLPITPSQDLGIFTQEIHKLNAKIDHLEALITQLLPNKKSTLTPKLPKEEQGKGNNTQPSANQERQQAAITKARDKFIELNSPDISRAELARQAGVDRNTVGKHWAIITQLELPNVN